MQLTEEQELVIDRFLNTNNKIFGLQGYAGTGKTFTAAEIIRRTNDGVMVIAPTAAALSALKSKLDNSDFSSRIEFKTIAQLTSIPVTVITFFGMEYSLTSNEAFDELCEMFNNIGVINVGSFIDVIKQTVYDHNKDCKKEVIVYNVDEKQAKNEIEKAMNSKISDTDFTVESRFILISPLEVGDRIPHHVKIIIADEMSMVDEEVYQLLCNAVNECGKPLKILFCGDPGQLPPVNGVLNKAMLSKPANEENNIYELTKILRNTDAIAHLASEIRHGGKINNLKSDCESGIIINNLPISVDQVLEGFKDDIINADCIITFTNKNVNKLNNFIRLHKNNLPFGSHIQEGETLLVTANSGKIYNSALFANGEQVMVKKIYDLDDSIQFILDLPLTYNDKLEDTKKIIVSILPISRFRLAEVETKLGDVYTCWLDVWGQAWNWSLQDKAMASNLNAIYQACCDDKTEDVPVLRFTLGYAMTTHKAQGSEWSNLIYLVTKKDLYVVDKSGSYKELMYTAVTRAKDKLTIFVCND